MSDSTFSWMSPKLEMIDTGKYGKGLFTSDNIRKNELLCVFGGYVMTRREEELLPEDYNDTGIQISEDLVMSVRDRAELSAADYINHCCSPNSGIKGQIFLVAMKKIGGGRDYLRLRNGALSWQGRDAV
jgi:SET domain-containing protein